MSFKNVNVANFNFILRLKLPKLQNILESELSNFQILQSTLLQSCQMSFKNVNVANFNFILRLKLPKLQIS